MRRKALPRVFLKSLEAIYRRESNGAAYTALQSNEGEAFSMLIVIGILFFVILLANCFFYTVGWAVTYALLAILSIHFILMYRRRSANRVQL